MMTNLESLTIATPSDRELVLTRLFKAPRRRVFDALTNPELLKQWFGPSWWSLDECDTNLRPGGSFRYVMHGPDGAEMITSGVFREIAAPERLIHTELIAGYGVQGTSESRVTTILVEIGGITVLTSSIVYVSRVIREAVISSGVEYGIASSYDRLADLLAED